MSNKTPTLFPETKSECAAWFSIRDIYILSENRSFLPGHRDVTPKRGSRYKQEV